MTIHAATASEAVASLHSEATGLTSAEAQRRLAEFGRNLVEPARSERPWLTLLKEFTHFFAIILWVAAGLALLAEARTPGQGMATLGIAIIGVIVVNGAFSFWQTYRAGRALDALQDLLPNQTKVLRDGTVTMCAAELAVPGDIVVLQAGDRVPADARIISGPGLHVDNATVTGESVPQWRDAEPCAGTDPIQSTNTLLAGTLVISGAATAIVFATGANTVFGRIALLSQAEREPLSPLQEEVARLSRLIAVLAVGIGVLFFLIGRFMGLSFWTNLILAIGIIVANVPEGLLPTMTLALAMASQRMSKRRALIRHLPAVETLGCTSVICTDKTGTLTLNKMSARRVLAGTRNHDAGQVDASIAGGTHLFKAALSCGTLLRVGEGASSRWKGNSTEVALAEFARSLLPHEAENGAIAEIPFDGKRKRLTTLHQGAEGMILYVKGAPETVLPLCTQAEEAGAIGDLTREIRAQIQQAHEEMAESGLRVIAFAFRRVTAGRDPREEEHDLIYCGLIGLADPARPEVAEAAAKCREAGIKVIMVTGDHPQTALAIAREVGIVQGQAPRILTGADLQKLSETQLQVALDAPEILFARVTADQKMRIVQALKRKKHVVAVTGDGVNDAPALRAADIGIAMGLCGTDVAREAADMVLLDDSFSTIVAAIEEGRAVFANIRKFLTYILSSNVPEVVPYLAFALFSIPLPLTVIQILAVDLGTDMVPAIALGVEPPGPLAMKGTPRPRAQGLLDRTLLFRAYGLLGTLEAAAAMSAYFYVLHRGGWQFGDPLGTNAPLYLQATTACLTAIVVMQVFNVFLCRSARRSAFAGGVLRNKLILAGVGIELALILLIVFTPWGNALLGTHPITMVTFLFAVPFGATMLLIDEWWKWRSRRGSEAAANQQPKEQGIPFTKQQTN